MRSFDCAKRFASESRRSAQDDMVVGVGKMYDLPQVRLANNARGTWGTVQDVAPFPQIRGD
jgi:hypothetical protein